jgi:hypothetical protein
LQESQKLIKKIQAKTTDEDYQFPDIEKNDSESDSDAKKGGKVVGTLDDGGEDSDSESVSNHSVGSRDASDGEFEDYGAEQDQNEEASNDNDF